MQTEWIRYGDALQFTGYASWPERAALPLPAVIVVQEAFGVNAWIEDVVGRFARAGYFAFAPDLFAREGERPEALSAERLRELVGVVNTMPPSVWRDGEERARLLGAHPEPERSRLGASFERMLAGIREDHSPQLLATTAFLRGQPATAGQRVGAVGFCVGGHWAGRLAGLDPGLSAAAVFYGMAPPDALIAPITCPVLGFYGGKDLAITDAIPSFAQKMKAQGKQFHPHVYATADHAFFNDTRPPYNVAAARDSWEKVLAFFAGRLVG